ncbi:MAG: virB8 family protein [Rickettsiaceae bacterium]|nr:virB8 family protein [Rickettsiaceae bacterium]
MLKIGDFFKKSSNENALAETENNASKSVSYVKDSNSIKPKGWYEERYEILLVQRNILSFLFVVSLLGIVLSIIAVLKISTSKEFDPFVISIDEKTGLTTVVKPLSRDILLSDRSLSQYFIKRYISARETYNVADFNSQSRSTVRVLSNNNVYWQYVGYIRDNDPSKKYADKNSTYLTVKSWSQMDKNKYIVRFTITETQGEMKTYNKIAIVVIDYITIELTPQELDINPVGFQVNAYKVDDDNS